MKVSVIGPIVSDDMSWVYQFFKIEHFCPQMLRQALAAPENAAEHDLTLEINSPGGSVWAGFDVYSLLQGLQLEGWNVEAHVTAMAASAASTIMAACRTVLLSPVAQVMIHDPSTSTYGNIRDHSESLGALRSIKESIINGYLAKCRGKTNRGKFRQLMEDSTWMPAQQAIDLGLADGYIGGEETVSGTDLVLSAVNSAADENSYAALLDRYVAGVRNGTLQEDPEHPIVAVSSEDAPVNPQPDNVSSMDTAGNVSSMDTSPDARWQMQARIELERQRCLV